MTAIDKETVKAPFGHSATTTQSVQFKGRPGALEVQLDEETSLLIILAELDRLLNQNQNLLGKTALALNFGERPIDALQYKEVRRVIERYGHKVTKLQVRPLGIEAYLEGEFGIPVELDIPQPVVETPEIQPESVPAPPSEVTSTHTSHPPTQISPPPTMPALHPEGAAAHPTANQALPEQQHLTQPYVNAPTRIETASRPPMSDTHLQSRPPKVSPGLLPEFETQPESPSRQANRPGIVATGDVPYKGNRVLHKILRTCRAGTLIDVDGDVVLFGDLNPGAEIRATGDIIVFGSMRGIAHAGCEGDTDAIIAAYDLSPTQLRLAGQIAIAPAEELRPRVKTPIEVAYLNTQKQIEVEACVSGKFPPIIRQLSL